MIVSHLILHKKIQFYIFMCEAWNVAKGRKVQGGWILSQGTVALIEYLTCVIKWKFDFYIILFVFGALHFPWLLAKWDASVPYPRGFMKRASLLLFWEMKSIPCEKLARNWRFRTTLCTTPFTEQRILALTRIERGVGGPGVQLSKRTSTLECLVWETGSS